jgi:hypothetical protein
MYFSHRLQYKFESEINQTQIKILKIPMVGYFYLIYPSKWYHVYKNPTIHLLDLKYGRYTLKLRVFRFSDLLVMTWFMATVSHDQNYFILIKKETRADPG